MSASDQATSPQSDLFGLSNASMEELIADIESEPTLADEGGAAPPRAEQVAALILAEAIHLIRMGSRVEIASASSALSQLLVRIPGEKLQRRHEEAYRLASGASVALSGATPASSKGGARMVLRSWKGRAREVVEMLRDAQNQRLFRSEIGDRLGIEDASHLSHLLTDLEAARLIIRIKTGREVIVRLGPAADSDEVREALGGEGEPIFKLKGGEVDFFDVFTPNIRDFGRQVPSVFTPFDTTLPTPLENELQSTSLTVSAMTVVGKPGDEDILKPSTGFPNRLRQSQSARTN